MQRSGEIPSTTTGTASSNIGPWDDVEHAWGRGGYIERAVGRDCGSYLPTETLSYANDLDIDHLGKETLTTAMRRNPKRWGLRQCFLAIVHATCLPCIDHDTPFFLQGGAGHCGKGHVEAQI